MANRLKVYKSHLQMSKVNAMFYVYVDDVSVALQSAGQRSPVTTHVLDTARGRPAGSVPVEISVLSEQDGSWTVLGSGSVHNSN